MSPGKPRRRSSRATSGIQFLVHRARGEWAGGLLEDLSKVHFLFGRARGSFRC